MCRFRLRMRTLTAVGIAAAAACSMWSAEAQQPVAVVEMPPGPVRLEVGEAITFCVQSRSYNNRSGVWLECGAHYEFEVARGDTWCDAKIRCGPNGWTVRDVRLIARPLIRALEPRRRCPAANWFELIGAVGCDECELFRIGCRGAGWTYTPCRDGELVAFANDVPRRYHNNSGSLMVTVQRVPAPGRRLPGCGR